MSLYDRLAKKPKLFTRCTGLTVSEFNLVAGRLAKKYPRQSKSDSPKEAGCAASVPDAGGNWI